MEIEAIKGLWLNEASIGPEECLEGWQELLSIVILNDSMCWDLSHGLGDRFVDVKNLFSGDIVVVERTNVVIEAGEGVVIDIRVRVRDRSGGNAPIEIAAEPVDSFLPGKPCGHLFNIILLVSSGISVLHVVDVKAFWQLSVVTVSRTIENNHLNVVFHGVNLWNVEVILGTSLKFDEYLFVGMEGIEGGCK